MFFKQDEMYVAVSTEPGPPYVIMQKLEERFQVQQCNRESLSDSCFPVGISVYTT